MGILLLEENEVRVGLGLFWSGSLFAIWPFVYKFDGG